jgi:hypothetical protein
MQSPLSDYFSSLCIPAHSGLINYTMRSLLFPLLFHKPTSALSRWNAVVHSPPSKATSHHFFTSSRHQKGRIASVTPSRKPKRISTYLRGLRKTKAPPCPRFNHAKKGQVRQAQRVKNKDDNLETERFVRELFASICRMESRF